MALFDDSSSRIRDLLANTKPLLREDEAVEFLAQVGFPISRHTLTTLRSRGGGPEWRRATRWAVYEPRALLAYAEQKVSPPLDRARSLEDAA